MKNRIWTNIKMSMIDVVATGNGSQIYARVREGDEDENYTYK